MLFQHWTISHHVLCGLLCGVSDHYSFTFLPLRTDSRHQQVLSWRALIRQRSEGWLMNSITPPKKPWCNHPAYSRSNSFLVSCIHICAWTTSGLIPKHWISERKTNQAKKKKCVWGSRNAVTAQQLFAFLSWWFQLIVLVWRLSRLKNSIVAFLRKQTSQKSTVCYKLRMKSQSSEVNKRRVENSREAGKKNLHPEQKTKGTIHLNKESALNIWWALVQLDASLILVCELKR